MVAEIANDKNRGLQFPPLRIKLRGRWDPMVVAKAGHTGSDELQKVHACGVIPGMHIEINVDGRYISIWDPLTETANGKAVWERISKEFENNTNFEKCRLSPRRHMFNASDDEIKTYLYWLARAVAGGSAVLVKGRLPTRSSRNADGQLVDVVDFEPIEGMPGKRTADPWTSTPQSDEK